MPKIYNMNHTSVANSIPRRQKGFHLQVGEISTTLHDFFCHGFLQIESHPEAKYYSCFDTKTHTHTEHSIICILKVNDLELSLLHPPNDANCKSENIILQVSLKMFFRWKFNQLMLKSLREKQKSWGLHLN